MNKDTLKFKNTLWLLWLKTVQLCLIRIIDRVLSTGGSGGSSPSPKRLSFLPPKSFLEKKLKLFQRSFLTTILGNQWRLLMSRNAIQPILNTIFSKLSGGACLRTPPEGLKKFFLAAAWLKNFFQDRLPPPKQKILDRTLIHSTHTPPPHPPAYIKLKSIRVNCKLLWYFSLVTSQVEAIKLYKLLNTAEKLKHNHRKKLFNWCN